MRHPCRPLVLCLVAGLAGGSHPAPSRLDLGSVVLDYDATDVVVTRTAKGFDLSDPGAGWRREASVAVETATDAPCDAAAMTAFIVRDPDDTSVETRVLASGTTLVAAMGRTGCRNGTGRPLAACVRERGVTTTFKALGAGCRTPTYQDELVLAVLSGLRPAP